MDETAQSDLDVRNLTVTLGGRHVLKNQSLKIKAGEIIGIMGPSGCGKTTLLRSIARLQPADSGILRFMGKSYSLTNDMTKSSDDPFYPEVSFVPQTLALWPHFTNYQNIVFPLNGKSTAVVSELARRLHVDSVLQKKPEDCSHGQRQRVALIRALVLQPRLLLLDEVTSALDRSNAECVAELIREIVSKGAMVLAVTHDIRFAQAVATRVLEMDLDGNLSAPEGTFP